MLFTPLLTLLPSLLFLSTPSAAADTPALDERYNPFFPPNVTLLSRSQLDTRAQLSAAGQARLVQPAKRGKGEGKRGQYRKVKRAATQCAVTVPGSSSSAKTSMVSSTTKGATTSSKSSSTAKATSSSTPTATPKSNSTNKAATTSSPKSSSTVKATSSSSTSKSASTAKATSSKSTSTAKSTSSSTTSKSMSSTTTTKAASSSTTSKSATATKATSSSKTSKSATTTSKSATTTSKSAMTTSKSATTTSKSATTTKAASSSTTTHMTTTSTTKTTGSPSPTASRVSVDTYGDGPFSGWGTWFDVGLGACGWYNVPADPIVAVSAELFDNWPGYNGWNPNDNPICGKHLEITWGGKSLVVQVADRCPGCSVRSLDLSIGAFEHFATLDVGLLGMDDYTKNITWSWVSGSGALAQVPVS